MATVGCGGAACDSLTGVAGWLEDGFKCQLPLLALEGVLPLRCHSLVCTVHSSCPSRLQYPTQYYCYWYATATLFGKLWHPASWARSLQCRRYASAPWFNTRAMLGPL